MASEEKETRNRTSANGEGSCRYIESKKLWCSRVTVGWKDTPKGRKQVRKAFYGKTKKDALAKATEAQARVLEGKPATSSIMKLSDWADKWMQSYCSQLSPRTVTGYKSVIENLIKPAVGQLSLKKLKPLDIQTAITGLVEKGYSKSHINRARVLLNSMLEDAIDNDLLIKNPCRKVSLPPMPARKRKQEPFTDDEVTAIINYAKQYLTQSVPHVMHRIGKMIIIMLRTGMRREEVLALPWGCIDFENNIIRIRQAVTVKDGEPILKEPKTFHSRRDIPMHPEVKKLLSDMEGGADDDFVFPTESGGLIHPRNFNRDYTKFFEASGIKYRSPHCCRHTFASQLREKGVDFKTISELLGHSRIEITDIYTHTNEKSKEEAISRL